MTEQLDGSLFGEHACFGCSPSHPFGFRLVLEKKEGGVVANWTPHEHYQGPPGIMHGGLVTTLADEVAAWAIIAELGAFGFTVSIEARLKKPIRIGVPTRSEGSVVQTTGRTVDVQVAIAQEDLACYTAQMKFVLLDREGAERLLGRPLPAEWDRFTRSSPTP